LKKYKRRFSPALIFLVSIFVFRFSVCYGVSPSVRIKDIAQIKEARENQLMGFGLVVGLRHTGDGTQTGFTKLALTNLLSRMGLQAPSAVNAENMSSANQIASLGTVPNNQEFRSKNVASVMVTGTLLPYMKPGQKMDVTVSSLGDASSLQGGTLLMTPLQGADGQTYALAQGSLSLGSVNPGASELPMNREITTVGRIPGGAMIEKEVPVNIEEPQALSYPGAMTSQESVSRYSVLSKLTILLNDPDFTTASRVAYTIAKEGLDARAQDAAAVSVIISPDEDLVSLISKIENLEVVPDVRAKVVINERSGTVVIGENIRLAPVAVTYGNFVVQIGDLSLSGEGLPPGSSSAANLKVSEKTKNLTVISAGATLKSLVNSLNSIGASPRDLIAILQAIKSAGALSADIEVI
jgi:flagellar P-ring protein precursor FlgI